MADRQWDMIISFNTKAQCRAVLRILRSHNERAANPHKHPVHYVRHNIHEKHKLITSGNALWAVDIVTFKKGWRVGDQASPANGPALARGLVFSNTGSEAQKNRTFDYLNWHLLRSLPGVYHDGFPAMAVYICDDAVLNSLATREALADDVIHCASEPRPEDPMDLIQPAYWLTRTTEGNPAYRELMMNEEPGNEPRRKRMREEPAVVPFLSRYEDDGDGWTVYDPVRTRHWYFDKDSREDAEACARQFHVDMLADDGVEAEEGEAVD